MPLLQIVSRYTRRWNIETMFQDIRRRVGLGSTRRWCQNAVLRAEPWLFGLYSVIVLIYVGLPAAGIGFSGVGATGLALTLVLMAFAEEIFWGSFCAVPKPVAAVAVFTTAAVANSEFGSLGNWLFGS